jgi:hypothetical protein
MAGETLRPLGTCIRFSVKDKNGNASSSAFFNVLGTWTMTGFAAFPIRGISRHCLLAMDGFYKLVVIGFMAILAGFRTRILRIPSYNVRSHEDERKRDDHQRKKECVPLHMGSPPVFLFLG